MFVQLHSIGLYEVKHEVLFVVIRDFLDILFHEKGKLQNNMQRMILGMLPKHGKMVGAEIERKRTIELITRMGVEVGLGNSRGEFYVYFYFLFYFLP